VKHFEDDTQAALAWVQQARAASSNPRATVVSKPTFTPVLPLGPNAAAMSANIQANMQAGLLQVVSTNFIKN
jgi:hypothetical protein